MSVPELQLQAPRIDADVARLYVEARVAGLDVGHLKTRGCKTFDGVPPGARRISNCRRPDLLQGCPPLEGACGR